jgi:hypothetical protein
MLTRAGRLDGGVMQREGRPRNRFAETVVDDIRAGDWVVLVAEIGGQTVEVKIRPIWKGMTKIEYWVDFQDCRGIYVDASTRQRGVNAYTPHS